MAKCGKCSGFFEGRKDAPDYEPGKGNCVMEKESNKGKFWLSKPVSVDSEGCSDYKPSIKIA